MLTAADAGASSCRRLCAESADGMVYRVLGEFHYTDVIGQSAVGFAFTVTNNSRSAETFEPFPGFTAQLSTGDYVQYPTGYESASAADPKCSPVATQPGVITPLGYRVKPGQTGGPWEVCMALSPGQTVVKAVFADDNPNLHQNAVIPLTGAIPQLRTPLPPPPSSKSSKPSKPSSWWLPDPADLPAAVLSGTGDAVGRGCYHVWANRGTRRAYRRCDYNPTIFVFSSYVGFVPPSLAYYGVLFRGPGVAIPGFPSAELFTESQDPEGGAHPVLAVRFTRTIGGKRIYGQVAASFVSRPQCPETNRIANVEIAARALFKLLGPGPAPRLSLPPSSPLC